MRSLFVVALACTGACSLLSSDDPRSVAEDFWAAVQDGDTDRARELAIVSDNTSISDDGAPNIETVTLGEVERDGDEATIPTTIVGMSDPAIEVSFATVLAREDGVWKVHLPRTTDGMMRALLGSSMQDVVGEMGRAIGEAVGKATQGMAEGVAEGMRTLGDSLAAAGERKEPPRR